ncbi:hypothetical protein HPQ64_18705 [Rhizobiales bacterium]|nr:hypothetical protein [Hongsoonwoonella zoysiae]
MAAISIALAPFGAGALSAAQVKTEWIELDAPEAKRGGGTAIPTAEIERELRSITQEPAPEATAASPLPEVRYGENGLPKPVARMRAQILEAAYSGDIERMRMVLEANEVMPTLTFGEMDDPIEFLKDSSGDGEGHEILAILTEILEAGWIKVDEGTAQEMYVWPYFARYPLSMLTPQQKVEMYRIVTSGDVVDMEAFGAWNFYRVGIGPDGTLHYFVAGD